MRKVLFALVLVAMFVLMAMPCFAKTAADKVADCLTGQENSYIGIEAIKDIDLKAPILFIEKVGLKVWSDVETGKVEKDEIRDFRGGIRLRLIF